MTIRYPIGIQTFSEIIKNNYVYVDKTDLVWQLTQYAKYIFLSRPRRFGKSLLTTTLASYFRGEKELFEGLKMMELEKEWRKFKYDITSMDNIESTDYAINRPTEAMTTMVPLLYQSGYLTIKDYDPEVDIYTLSIPNLEVRIGYTDGLLPAYSGLEGEDVQAGFALKFWRALKKRDVEQAMKEMQAYMAAIPYVEGFKKKLAEAATAEGFYEYTLYLIFSMLNVYARTQVKCAGGRVDMVVWMPDTIYVFELREQREQNHACMNFAESRPKSSEAQLKANGTAKEALKQIDDKGYAIPYQTDGRPMVKVGVKFDAQKRVPVDWVVEQPEQASRMPD